MNDVVHLSLGSIIVASERQVSTDLANETAILNLDSGVYYGLNEVGALVWREVQHPRSVADLRDAILKEYDVDPEACIRDLFKVLRDLATAGLVEIRPAA